MGKVRQLKLLKNNRLDQQFDVDIDEIIERFCRSSYAKDKRRELKVRVALFIASSEGYDSCIAKSKEFNQLIKRYKLINHKFK